MVISWRDKKPKQQKMLLVILMVTSKFKKKKKRIRKDMIQVKKHLRKHSDSFSWV